MLGVCREEDEVFFACCPEQRRDQVAAVGGVARPLVLDAVRIDPDMHGSRILVRSGRPGKREPEVLGAHMATPATFPDSLADRVERAVGALHESLDGWPAPYHASRLSSAT